MRHLWDHSQEFGIYEKVVLRKSIGIIVREEISQKTYLSS